MSLLVQRLGRIGYEQALSRQEVLATRKVAGESDDYLLLLEHDPVYTLGRGANESDLCGADKNLGVPSIRVGRGGGVTFHGPGQLVAYPILTLPKAGRDVHRYVRNLEEVLIRVCQQFAVWAFRRQGETGVWASQGKIASIGIGVRRWTTLHGVALNVTTDLSYFDVVVPCRVPQLPMTSVQKELGVAPPLSAVEDAFVAHFCSVFGFSSPSEAPVASHFARGIE